MTTLRERIGLADAPSPSLAQVVDALILFDTPLLDQRFQEAIAMHPDAHVRAMLAALPPRVAKGSRVTRRAGIEWERISGGSVLEDEFKQRAERFLLEALLESAEAQIQLKTFMAQHAPTREIRGHIDEAIGIHRELAQALRHALAPLDPSPQGAPPVERPPYLGAEDGRGDLRSQVEEAIRSMRASGQKPRSLLVSSNALRHLRDQGLFQDGARSVLDVPVRVDFSWPGSCFALLSFESASLDEIFEGTDDNAVP